MNLLISCLLYLLILTLPLLQVVEQRRYLIRINQINFSYNRDSVQPYAVKHIVVLLFTRQLSLI